MISGLRWLQGWKRLRRNEVSLWNDTSEVLSLQAGTCTTMSSERAMVWNSSTSSLSSYTPPKTNILTWNIIHRGLVQIIFPFQMKWVMAVDSHLHRCSFGSGLVNLAGSCCLVVLKQPSSASEKKKWHSQIGFIFPKNTPEDWHRIWKWWFGRGFSFSRGVFSGSILIFQGVIRCEQKIFETATQVEIDFLSFDENQMTLLEGVCVSIWSQGTGVSKNASTFSSATLRIKIIWFPDLCKQ